MRVDWRDCSAGLTVALTAVMAGTFGLVLVALAMLGGASGGGFADLVCSAPRTVGATEYGGPGDPSSGTVGASGVSLNTQLDSYAELGGSSFATATALGGLPYGSPLAISVGDHTVIAYKEDIGLGGGPVDGYRRVIDLWWRLAQALGIPYAHGRWAGLVRIQAVTVGCEQPVGEISAGAGDGSSGSAGVCGGSGVCAGAGGDGDGVPVIGGGDPAVHTTGLRAVLLSNGMAAAPLSAPAAVQGIIAAGNQIVGSPYRYGAGHGLPLNLIATAYDCSSSVAHLLYGGGLLLADADLDSTDFESWGLPGPGRWVTIYANAQHVFMYVAGLRWDTWNAAGPGDGSTGIGWHPLVRSAVGFVARHPPGL
ncbi:MAG: hypothetical protein ACP5H2_05980 [Solirubrobacteraceae bacterium]